MKENGKSDFDDWLENRVPSDFQSGIREEVNFLAGEKWLIRGGGQSSPEQLVADTLAAQLDIMKKYEKSTLFNPRR